MREGHGPPESESIHRQQTDNPMVTTMNPPKPASASASGGTYLAGCSTLGTSARTLLVAGLVAALLGPVEGRGQSPTNDKFVDRTPATGEVYTGQVDNTDASYESGEPNHGQFAGATWLGKTVWWSWTVPSTGVAVIDTLGSEFDTLLAVYAGSSVGSLTTLAANDNADDSTSRSSIRLPVTAGSVLQIVVDSTSATRSSGMVKLNIRLSKSEFLSKLDIQGPAATGNDIFANRVSLTGTNVSAVGYNTGAGYEGSSEPIHSTYAGGSSWLARTIWWSWKSPANGMVSITTLGSMRADGGDLDTLLAVYAGPRIDGLRPVAANDDVEEGNRASAVVFPVTEGRVYQIAVDGNTGSRQTGAIVLNINYFRDGRISESLLPTPAAVENDLFVNRILLSGRRVSAIGYSLGASNEGGSEPVHVPNWLGKTVWWSWTADSEDPVTIDTVGSDFDTVLAVYPGTSLGALTRIAANDNASEGDRSSKVNFVPVRGENYKIVVDGNNATKQSGSIVLNINQDSPIPVDTLRIVQAMEIEFGTKPGVLYRLQRSEDLVTWAYESGDSRVGTGQMMRWLVSTESRPFAVYRLVPTASLAADEGR